MTGGSSDGSEQDKEVSTAQLVGLYDDINQEKKDEMSRPGVLGSLFKNPLIPLGMAITTYFMFKGFRSVSSGKSMDLAHALQGRVVGQFGTIMVIIGTATYMAVHAPEKFAMMEEDKKLIQAMALKNYRDARMREMSDD